MVNVPLIRRLLNNLEGYVGDLKSADDITHAKYVKDIRIQRFVERTIHIAIECCIDIVQHIISSEGFREPVSYPDAFLVLAEKKILSPDSMNDYRQMAQIRNKIVHYYEKIDPEQVYTIFRTKLDTFDSFRRQIEMWMDSCKNSGPNRL